MGKLDTNYLKERCHALGVWNEFEKMKNRVENYPEEVEEDYPRSLHLSTHLLSFTGVLVPERKSYLGTGRCAHYVAMARGDKKMMSNSDITPNWNDMYYLDNTKDHIYQQHFLTAICKGRMKIERVRI